MSDFSAEREQGRTALGFIVIFVLVAGLLALLWFFLPQFFSVSYDSDAAVATSDSPAPKVFVATHVKTPESVKALYMTSWVGGNEKRRSELVELVDTTELNSIVVDIKDYTGLVAFPIEGFLLPDMLSVEKRIPDIREFIARLHEKNIYVIGRISVFQDPQLVKKRPDLAVKRSSDKTLAWKDYKGISWLDAGAPEVWQYVAALAEASYKNGFDEINFDYIRFPSDGNMKDIYYPVSDGKVKADVIESFFTYLHDELSPKGIILSADLFGMTTTNTDDLNIGQVLEKALPHFDYIAPMVYPSHYPTGFMGFKNPAAMPYEVVKYSMEHAVNRASTTPLKMRPWLQDFSLGADYTAEMVRKQIQATYDSGLASWMIWSAANRYTKAALTTE